MLMLILMTSSFVIMTIFRPYYTQLDNRLELLNEATLILIIYSLYSFTDVMNAGNVNDVDMHGNKYNKGTLGSFENLNLARFYAGYLLIFIFSVDIGAHCLIIIDNTARITKLRIIQMNAIYKRHKKREKEF